MQALNEKLERLFEKVRTLPKEQQAAAVKVLADITAEPYAVPGDELAVPQPALADPVLIRFRAALDKAYGERIERVVLFGSRARGEARPESDYDIAVFLRDLDSFGAEAGKIAAIGTEILYDTGAVINAIPFKAGAYEERTGLMQELRRDGVDL
jgi:uncharacterized protein